ncbi:TlpA family protein disulfide reductase [Butyricimonas synergistica]|uniref:TlpA family protein disulfide reductase n=1 Tax=Butyricimonas synergistica TaxID=544644 RepID=UPI0003A0530E|nr:TlpA disulfide reductase family protein [Butyricimonas synergistica]
MKKFVLFVFAVMLVAGVKGQEKLEWYFEKGMVKSFLGKKAPKLVVEEWVSAKADTAGKFIVLELWKINCNPCVKNMPHMNELSKKFKQEVAFIALGSDPAEKVRTTDRVKIEFFNAVDTKKTTMQALGLKFVPYTLVIDPKGIVRWEGSPANLTEEVLKEIIKKYKK